MEDVHKLILWEEIKQSQLEQSNKCSEPSVDERASKRQKQQISEQSEKISQGEEPTKETSDTDTVETRVSFFIVCDGHGGIEAADFVNAHLFNKIITQPTFAADPEKAIMQGFADTEEAFVKLATKLEWDGLVGTTVTAVLIMGNFLYVANIGDSEAVICSKGKAKVLTECHSLNNEAERNRIEALGGVIVSDRRGSHRLGHPVWNPNYVNIALTRAIGDLYFKSPEYISGRNSGLIAVPYITKWQLTTDDSFMIIASDGFWDVVSYDEAVEMVKVQPHMESERICQQLVEFCKSRNSDDNITVLLVKFTVV